MYTRSYTKKAIQLHFGDSDMSRLLPATIVALLGAVTSQVLPGPPSQMDGNYTDPHHMHCPRTLSWESRAITGADVTGQGATACEAGSILQHWSVPIVNASRDGTLIVDFSNNGGPHNLHGVFEGFHGVFGIRWADGNFWRWHHPEAGTADQRVRERAQQPAKQSEAPGHSGLL